MLDYLVTSASRRRLLRLLWSQQVSGNVSELARQAGLSFSATHRELEAMRTAGLAVSERSGNRVVYRHNAAHPQADQLRELLATANSPAENNHDATVRSWLRAEGAPLGDRPAKSPLPFAEVVAEALSLSHRDATVARVLPVLLFGHRNTDRQALTEAATRRNERATLGMFLQLAGELGHDAALKSTAEDLLDRRRRRLRPFFSTRQGPRALAAARRNTPAVARKWGFLMNMGLDSFASTFTKHTAR